MTRAAITILLALSCTPAVLAQAWSIDDRPFPNSIHSLPADEQRAILATLSPSIEQYAKQQDLDPNEIATVRKSLHVQRVKTRSSLLLLVQTWGSELCGAVGNCAVWVLDEHDHLLLDGAGGTKVTVTDLYHHGLPDIRFSIHDSASETDTQRWQFATTRYRLSTCATIDKADPVGNPYKHPRLAPHTCDR